MAAMEMDVTLDIRTDPEIAEVVALADRLERLIEIFKDCTIRVLELKPGDVIVLESRKHMNTETYERLLNCCKMVWPDNNATVLEDGLRLADVTRESE
jgi:hypothetical protein